MRISDKSLISKKTVFDFDVSNQHKTNCDDFIKAFEQSIYKRSRGIRERIFLGLSSGYDSGAIANELTKQNVAFKAYTIMGRENKEVLEDRHKLLLEKGEFLDVSYNQLMKAKQYLKRNCEEFIFPDSLGYKNKNMTDDPGAIGLSYICSLAKKDGIKIYLSGQGSDEILSDYGRAGKKLSKHSTFAGVFPKDLKSHFPWLDFYEGAQVSYIAKEEHVAGSYGLEGRYPFLDKDFVQEFLWLDVSLKNKGYKYPLYKYLLDNNYPVDKDNKIGFVMPSYTYLDKLNPSSLLLRFYYLLLKKLKRK